MEAIVQPLTIKGKTMKNRIVVAPAERVGLTYTDNIMGADVIREYETLAENNAGLIMTQSLVVAPEDAAAVGFPLPGIWKETQIAPLKDGHYEVAQHWENHLRWARQKFNKQFKEEMPQVTPHVCRHTFCSNMASLGMSPKTLQITVC